MSDVYFEINHLLHSSVLTSELLIEKLKNERLNELSMLEKTHLIFIIIDVCFRDKIFTKIEFKNIETLKGLLKINEGDLLKNKPDAIKTFILIQIDFFLKDGVLDEIETEKLISLQSVFDLSFDEFRNLLFDELKALVIEKGLDKESIGQNYFLL